MVSTIDEKVFLEAMSRLASIHTGTQAHLQKINVVQDALCQCAIWYDTIDHGLWEHSEKNIIGTVISIN
jgi:hypothetical protein